MNYKMIGRFLAQILTVEAVFMVPAAIISAADHEIRALHGFLWSLGIICAVVSVLFLLCRQKADFTQKKDWSASPSAGS